MNKIIITYVLRYQSHNKTIISNINDDDDVDHDYVNNDDQITV